MTPFVPPRDDAGPRGASGARRAPRLVVRVLSFSFAVITLVLVAVLLVLTWQTRDRLTRAVVDAMEAGQQRFANLEVRRTREQVLRVEALAENPTLKAAVDTYVYESRAGGPADQLVRTLQRELDKLQQRLAVPVLAVTDLDGRILTSAGPLAADWRAGSAPRGIGAPAVIAVERTVALGTHVYLATVVPMTLGAEPIGQVVLGAPLDDAYAEELAREAGADVAILVDGRVIGASSSAPPRTLIEAAALPAGGTAAIGNEEFVVRRLSTVDSAAVYALGSVTAALRSANAEVASVLLVGGLGALILGAVGSLWLARTLSAPIDELTGTVAAMARARDLDSPIRPSGTSRETDALARTFDALRLALAAAEAESKAAYVGVIGSLAAALDARDPYTAGHSERVAALSVAIGRRLGLDEAALETLRLGALLHDIGKIGVADAILRKPGTLTAAEFEQIKRHPTLGARILRPLPFLAEQIAIVELHHEQPDGRGYPFGLRQDEVPLSARIVHVADAFDAMVTARAYRPGRPASDALAELRRHAGTAFDADVVQAISSVPSAQLIRAAAPPADSAREPASLVDFPERLRAAGTGPLAG